MIQSGQSEEIHKYINDKKKIIDEHLDKILDQEESLDLKEFYSAMRYTVLSEGKRIRPIMAIATYEMFQRDSLDNIIEPACTIELIHAGSLMLDDLPCMDDAEFRRGKMTSHRVYGESTTVLASAALWVKVFRILSEIPNIRINDLIKETSDSIGQTGLILGQYLDVNSFEKEVATAKLIEFYKLKTSSLFKLAVKMGAILGNAKNEEIDILQEFGVSFGIAFQIRDDIIDSTYSKEQSGKDVNVDMKNKKVNLVSIIGLESAKRTLSEKIKETNEILSKLDRDVSILRNLTENLII